MKDGCKFLWSVCCCIFFFSLLFLSDFLSSRSYPSSLLRFLQLLLPQSSRPQLLFSELYSLLVRYLHALSFSPLEAIHSAISFFFSIPIPFPPAAPCLFFKHNDLQWCMATLQTPFHLWSRVCHGFISARNSSISYTCVLNHSCVPCRLCSVVYFIHLIICCVVQFSHRRWWAQQWPDITLQLETWENYLWEKETSSKSTARSEETRAGGKERLTAG